MRTEQGKDKRGKKVEKTRKVKTLPTKGSTRDEELQVKGGGGKVGIEPNKMRFLR